MNEHTTTGTQRFRIVEAAYLAHRGAAELAADCSTSHQRIRELEAEVERLQAVVEPLRAEVGLLREHLRRCIAACDAGDYYGDSPWEEAREAGGILRTGPNSEQLSRQSRWQSAAPSDTTDE